MDTEQYIINCLEDYEQEVLKLIQKAVHSGSTLLIGIPSALFPGLSGGQTLPSKPAMTDQIFRQFKELCQNGKIQLIDCGFTSTPLGLLPPDLALLEQKWADSNPFGCGYSDLGLQKFLVSKHRPTNPSILYLQSLSEINIVTDKDKAQYLLKASGIIKKLEKLQHDRTSTSLGASMQGMVKMSNATMDVHFNFGSIKHIKLGETEIGFSPITQTQIHSRQKQFIANSLSAVSIESHGARGLRLTSKLSPSTEHMITDYVYIDSSDTLFCDIELRFPDTDVLITECIPWRFRIESHEEPSLSWKSESEMEELFLPPPSQNFLGESLGPWMRAFGSNHVLKLPTHNLYLNAPSPMQEIIPLFLRMVRNRRGLFYEIAPFGVYFNFPGRYLKNLSFKAVIGLRPGISQPPRELSSETKNVFKELGLFQRI